MASLVLAEGHARAADIAFGLAMRAYDFDSHKTGEKTAPGPVTLMATNPEAVAKAAAPMAAVAEGVFFTRDLVNEPANVLTTHDFADRLAAMQELGLDVEILEEDRTGQAWHGRASGRRAGLGKPLEGRRDALEWRQEGRGPLGAGRQGRRLRHRRHLDQARRRHGRDDDGHGRRGRRRGRDAHAGPAQGQGQCGGPGRVWSKTCPTAARSAPAMWSSR
jgi:hypothetical protein